MRDVLAAWKQIKGLIEEAETVHTAVAQRTDPTLVDVLLPLAYKHLINDKLAGAPDANAITSIAGHYLGQQYPELREYVLTDTQRDRLANLRAEIDAVLRGEDPR